MDGRENPLLSLVEGHSGPVDLLLLAPATPPALGSASTGLPPVAGLLAGAAEVDITPPPGMPKAGHSRNAQDGTGFRTRLRARVIHLRAGTTSLALVAADLHVGSAVLHRLVAQAIAEETDVRLPGLFLGTTHTHAGPGQFHGSEIYNRMASNRPGFDPAFTNFLAERIAGAVRAACATRRPARLAAGRTEVWGYTRNRSLDAHVRNETVKDKRLGAQRAYAAVNPWLHLLRVDAEATDGHGGGGAYEPLAALAVFSIHGTGISRHDPSYNADVWAYITGGLAQGIERDTGVAAVVGAVEGTHGDMTPAVRPGLLVYHEAERVGRGIGAAAAELHRTLEAGLTDQVGLAAGIREFDLGAEPVLAGTPLPDPVYGLAKIAGAKENTTPVVDRIPPFRAGYPNRWSKGPHGAKWVIPKGQDLLFPIDTFPRILTFQLLRIGPVALLGLPFEVTVESGRRIEAAVRQALPPTTGVNQVVVSSLANDYADYLTTPEEYTRQCYEGAGTLYGPSSQPAVAKAAAELARDLDRAGAVEDHLPARRFVFHCHRYLATPNSATRTAREILGPPEYVDATPTEDGYWQLTWRDRGPGDLCWHERLVRVEALDGDRWVPAVDDGGWHLGVSHLGPHFGPRRLRGSSHKYAARWYGPPLGNPGRHRFVLVANGGQPEVSSEWFD